MYRVRFIVKALVLLALVAAVSGPAAAREQASAAGVVVALRGRVSALGDAGERLLSLKGPVYAGESVCTTAGARVQLLFADRTIVSLGPSSQLKVNAYAWDPRQPGGVFESEVKEGVFRIMGGAITKTSPEHFTTRTPAATIGIRGSMYMGRVDAGELVVVFEGGRGIAVGNAAGEVVISRPGYATRSSAPDRAPQRPYRMSAKELSELNAQLEPPPAQDETSAAEASPEETDGETSADEAGEETSLDEAEEETSAEGTDEDTPAAASAGEASPDDTTDDTTDGAQTQADGGTPGDDSSDGTPAGDTPAGDDSISSVTSDTDLGATDSGETYAPPELTDTLTDVNQDTLDNTVTQTVTSTPKVSPVMHGKFVSALIDIDSPASTVTEGTFVEAQSTDGILGGRLVDAHDSSLIRELAFEVAPYDREAAYHTPQPTALSPYSVTLQGVARDFSAELATDPRGEFVVFGVPEATYTSGDSYAYRELGFLGVPATAVPDSGVSVYCGPALGYEALGGAGESEDLDMALLVNWHNHQALGFIDPKDDTGTPEPATHVFFFGQVDVSVLDGQTVYGITAVKVGGQRGGQPSEPITWIDGQGDFGRFYGSLSQGFGAAASGDFYDLSGTSGAMSPSGEWTLLAGAFLQEGTPFPATSPTGTSTWNGFVTGVAEDMSQPEVGRRLFMNALPDDFTLDIDRDSGNISGTLSAPDRLDANNAIDQLAIGGAYGSAYVCDAALVAWLGDGGGQPLVSGTNAGGLKDYGSYLVSEDPEDRFCDYATWGYWEVAYLEPTSGAAYHLHVPYSMWIAGERTAQAELTALAAAGLVGEYHGGARGFCIEAASGIISELTGGQTYLRVDFDPVSTSPISGNLTFSERTLTLTTGAIDSTRASFSAQVAGASSSTVQGAFYGPQAVSVGGSFDADFTGEGRYFGIFGGNR